MTYEEKLRQIVMESFPKGHTESLMTIVKEYCPETFFGEGANIPDCNNCDNCWNQDYKEDELNE